MYAYGLIGNCNISALIKDSGSIDWFCLPRPDSDPVFGRILDSEGGQFQVSLTSTQAPLTQQSYLENTNILVSDVKSSTGEGFRVTDFAPRFEQHGRMFRPLMLIRMIEPLQESCSIQVHCQPVQGWNKVPAQGKSASNHVSYQIRDHEFRVTTNMPLTYLMEGTPFLLTEKVYFAISWNASMDGDLKETSERFLHHTTKYWRTWVKHCSIPTLFQKETIRSALALKLHCYEDTGAILAAMTTSLPEEENGTRNWDYRFCWLRDSAFALSAFHNLGHFEEMEGFLTFLLNLAHRSVGQREELAPVFNLNCEPPLPELIHKEWKGFRGGYPVRTNNQAAEHIQNDSAGEMILTLAPIFLDERFVHLRTKDHEDLLAKFGKLAAGAIGKPDAGLWEIRDGWQEHSFTNLMSWAGLERLERIQKKGYLKSVDLDFTAQKKRASDAIYKAVIDNVLRNGPQDSTLDSALSLLPVLRFPDDAISDHTLDALVETLAVDRNTPGFYYRYTRPDDFGNPKSAFVVCSFWIAQALARRGRLELAKQIFENVQTAANPLGLFAEHYCPIRKLQLGNFPQAYSHVGVINTAFEISPPWREIL